MVKVRDVLRLMTYLSAATGYASVFPHIQPAYSLSFAVLAVFSIYREYSSVVIIPRWFLNIASVLVLMVSSYRVSAEFLVEPVLEALVILTAIKLMEEKKVRDYMQIYAMSMFLLIGSSFLSLSLSFALYFLLLTVLLTASLVLLAYFSYDPEMMLGWENVVKIAQAALIICAIAVPASVLFFLILPRTAYPVLGFLNRDTGHARAGFTDTVLLGGVSEIQEDNNAVFRAEMKRVPQESLYWRGVVLDTFDGKSWKSSGMPEENPKNRPGDLLIKQTIYLEPYGNRYLFALDRPVYAWTAKPRRTLTGFAVKQGIQERIKYRAASVASDFFKEEVIARERYLQLPRGFSPRIKNLVEQLTSGRGEGEAIELLFRFLKWGEFRYSTEGLPTADNPMEEFLFERKMGNCEYFASSLAVMLRMAGTPARLIGGYRGGYYNHAGRYYLVLQKNAHVWVEVYTPGGWLRLDPTPSVAGLSPAGYGNRFALQVKLFLDTFNYYWCKFILNYDVSTQLLILDGIRSAVANTNFRVDTATLSKAKYPVAGILALLLGAATICRLYNCRKGLERRAVRKFLRHMGRHGYAREAGEGLEEFVARVKEDVLRNEAHLFVEEFESLYYRDCRFSREDLKRLNEKLRSI